MSGMSAVSLTVKGFRLASIVVMGCMGFAESGGQTYLLSATPSNYGPETFAAELYKINDVAHVERVREVVASKDGVFAVEQAPNGDLVVLAPHVVPTDVSVVYAQDPLKAAMIHVNDADHSVLDTSVALVQTKNGSNAAIIPIMTSPEPRTIVHRQVDLAIDSPNGPNRVADLIAPGYERLRYAGTEGGPVGAFSLVGNLMDGSLSVDGQMVVALPRVTPRGGGFEVAILGATERFILFVPLKDLEVLSSQLSREIYIYDRLTTKTHTVVQTGNASSTRVVGPWFATSVRYLWDSSDDPRISDSPEYSGQSKETKELYLATGRRLYRTTGELVLERLDSTRRVKWLTGQEDSEVLAADANNVTYRVNDSIFVAKIGATSIEDSRLLVRSKEIPSVHWIISKGE